MAKKIKNVLTTRETAQLFKVHESSVKRWCESGELNFELTEGGHRRLKWTDLNQFSVQKNMSHSFMEFNSYEAEVYSVLGRLKVTFQYDECIQMIQTWFSDNKSSMLVPLLKKLIIEEKFNFAEMCDKFVFKHLEAIGDFWQKGVISISEEHRVSQEWIQSLSFLRYQLLENYNPKTDKKVLLACGDQNAHEIALMCLRIILEKYDYEITYLGTSVPAEDIIDFQRKEGYQLVAISFSADSHVNEILNQLKIFHDQPDVAQMNLVIGGQNTTHINTNLFSNFKNFQTFQSLTQFEKWIRQHADD